MVSTRGGTRTSAPDSEVTLKKKTVRKAAAKPTTATAAKAKTTRARKAEPEAEARVDVMDDELDELAEPAPAPVKTTRRGRPPVQKDEEPAKKTAAVKTTTRSKAVAKPTRVVAEKTTKAKPVAETKADEKARPKKAPELKPTNTRATRPTRATAAKEKAAPLSPKKITQVSKAPTKKAESGKTDAAKAPTKGRPVARRRGLSDENAGVPQLKPTTTKSRQIETDSTQSDMSRKTAERDPTTTKVEHKKDTQTDLKTTAQDQAGTLEQPEDVDSEDELLAEQGSDDELCAPKTPMKRCDPREQSRYSPAKNTRLPDADVPVQTPVRRFQVLGTQQGTPQTQRPYCKPSVPMSEVRPMTVARAGDTAMVFPRLQPLPQMFGNSDLESMVPPTGSAAETEEDMHMESSEDFVEQDSDTSLLVDASISEMPMAAVEASIDGEEVAENDEEHEQTGESSLDDVESEAPIGEGQLENDGTKSQDGSFLVANDNVLATPQDLESAMEESDESFETQQPSSTPGPETMVWENIREDVTIPFTFDVDATSTRSLPQAEPTERLSIVAEFASEFRSEDDVKVDDGNAPAVEIAFMPDLSVPRQREHNVGDFEDVTVNISDFVDVSSIAGLRDSTAVDAQIAAETDVDDSMARNPTVEDMLEDESVLDGDVTLMCEEHAASSPRITTPVKLTTVEDLAEEDLAADGDVTLMLVEPRCPATVKRSPVKLTTAEDTCEDEDAAAEGDITLDLNELPCPRTIERLPVKLTLAEDVPEIVEEMEGDVTLMLDSPLPQQPATPALAKDSCDSNVTPLDLEEADTAHYARSTFSSRRKSISDGSRPTTSDGERRPMNAQTDAGAWFDDVAASSQATPQRSRSSSAHTRRDRSRSVSRPRTPMRAAGGANPSKIPRDQFPGLPAQQSYENLVASNGAPKARSASSERFPGMPHATSYQELLDSPAAENPSVCSPTTKTPTARTASLKRKSLHEDEAELPEAATPQQQLPERFPGMPSRGTYVVQTAMPATRFRTPARQSPIRRPATTVKPTSLRKLALKAASTPKKAQVTATSQTPGQVPMTPHPAAPLRGVVALVDVYTHDGACASQSFAVLLRRLGAKTTKTFNENVTHVVFKEGSPKLLQAMTIRNKQLVAESGQEVFCVNSRWVNDCDAQGRRMPELDEEYAVDLDDYQRTAKRRRKSMEPMSLLKVNGGSVIRDRKSTAGRVSIGRQSTKGSLFGGPGISAYIDMENKENDEGSEPATPDYLKAPTSLIQQTVPAKRVHQLDLGGKADKQRRLTFADGLEF